jgi:hypothetical protein
MPVARTIFSFIDIILNLHVYCCGVKKKTNFKYPNLKILTPPLIISVLHVWMVDQNHIGDVNTIYKI